MKFNAATGVVRETSRRSIIISLKICSVVLEVCQTRYYHDLLITLQVELYLIATSHLPSTIMSILFEADVDDKKFHISCPQQIRTADFTKDLKTKAHWAEQRRWQRLSVTAI